jgi:hypothetical protein
MYGPQPLNFTLIAAAITPQYRFVLGSGENYGGQAVASTQNNLGIAQNSAGVNEHIAICPLGMSRCYVNSAVTAASLVTATASGGAAPAASGDMVQGIALEAGAIGDLVTVFVTPPWKQG